jgi:hypothetical protein
MLEDVIENMPDWLKAIVAMGTGITFGLITAKLIMIIGT